MRRIFILIPFIFLSCSGAPNKKPVQNDQPITSSEEIATIKDYSCTELLTALVRSSNALAFESFNKSEVQARIIATETDKLTIELYKSDISDRTGSEREMENTVGWLEFFSKRNKLMDITHDPDNPKELKYDKSILEGYNLLESCNAVTTPTRPSQHSGWSDVMLEKDIRFNGKVGRYFTLTEFKDNFGKPDSVKWLKDEAPCFTIFDTEAPDDTYIYKDGSRFETSKDSVAVDEFWFKNGNFITYKGVKIDASTTMDEIQRLFPTAVKGRLGLDKEGTLWVIKLREDDTGMSDGHIKLFFKNDMVYFMHWWFPC
ncbi:hypothetical protein [Sphingobacterium paucimobilis]|nr:hypothetical protein [Sphingobacterium paucimobilis]